MPRHDSRPRMGGYNMEVVLALQLLLFLGQQVAAAIEEGRKTIDFESVGDKHRKEVEVLRRYLERLNEAGKEA